MTTQQILGLVFCSIVLSFLVYFIIWADKRDEETKRAEEQKKVLTKNQEPERKHIDEIECEQSLIAEKQEEIRVDEAANSDVENTRQHSERDQVLKQLFLKEQQKHEEAKRLKILYEHELNFFEKQTDYCELLSNYSNGTIFSIIHEIAKNKVRELTLVEKDQSFIALKHGTAQLQTEREMFRYIFAYGEMHKAKLDDALSMCMTSQHYLFEDSHADVQIIDYGCGQAIGTVCFVDYMANIIKRLPNITTIRLIEPSEIVLKRGVLHVKSVFKRTSLNPNIYAIHKELSDIRNEHLITDHQSIKFHIFSNILDMDAFSLDDLCSKIVSTQKGVVAETC